jgi:hypothetical protein
MEIAAESGLGTTLLGNLMVANRPLATFYYLLMAWPAALDDFRNWLIREAA